MHEVASVDDYVWGHPPFDGDLYSEARDSYKVGDLNTAVAATSGQDPLELGHDIFAIASEELFSEGRKPHYEIRLASRQAELLKLLRDDRSAYAVRYARAALAAEWREKLEAESGYDWGE